MDSQDRQVLDAALRWAAAGHRLTLVSVARTWGSAPRPPGAWMVLRDDGLVVGSVSGGCVESDLIERLVSGQLAAAAPFVLNYGVPSDDARRHGLPCGGHIELLVEPAPDAAALAALSAQLDAGRRVRRSVEVGRCGLPGATLAVAAADDRHAWDGRTLTTLHGPAWRLLIVGAGQISNYLASMAKALDYQVIVCDPRSEYAGAWDVAGTTLSTAMPDDAVLELRLDAHSALVALTHDPKLDDLALLEALKSPAFYVGALGSQTTSARRRTPPEIAVSIIAEMTAVKNGASRVSGLVSPPSSPAVVAPN